MVRQLCGTNFCTVTLVALIGCATCFDFHERRPFDYPWQIGGIGSMGGGGGVGGFWPFTRKSLFPIPRRSTFVEDFTEGAPVAAPDTDDSYESLESLEPIPKPVKQPEPFDVGVITGMINNPDDTEVEIETNSKPMFSHVAGEMPMFPPSSGSLFNNFFGAPFFETFGLGGLGGAGGRRTPWWKGPNVCTERQEDVEDWDASESAEKKSSQSFSLGIHLSLNSCTERSHKHICTTIVNDGGNKKTLKVTKQCCHGFARKSNDPYAPCEKFDLYPMTETAEKLGGKEFISIARKNGLTEILDTNVTVFMPKDSSFAEFSEQMLETNLVMIPLRRRRYAANDISGFTNKDLILNHIVSDLINIEDIENEQLLVSDFNNLTIRMNIFPAPPNDKSYVYPYRYTANCAPIVKVNQIAESGIVHVIDNVLTPVTMNLMEIIKSRSDMAVLRTVLEKTNLAQQLQKEHGQYTMFAPTDQAFDKLDPHLKRTIKDGNGCALNILKNHILDMTFCTVAVVDDAKIGATNTLGLKINLERADNNKNNSNNQSNGRDIELADDLITAGADDDKTIMVNGEATILEKDIMGTNGVLHVIDTVLTTESGMPFTSMLEKRNLTIFKRLIEANVIDTEIDSIMNATFFAPVDKAFEDSEWKMRLDENPAALRNDVDLKKMIEYHIARPLTKTCDLSEKMITTVSGEPLRVNLYSTHSVFNNVINRATANCARLIHFDEDTCGSVLHQIDRILMPPKHNLLKELESNKHYSMFLRLVRDANLTSVLEDPTTSLTVLVPTNDIFGELDQFYDELSANPKQLEKFVKLHVLDDVLCCAGIVQTEWPFVRLVKTINNYDLKIGRDRRPKIQNAGVTKCDIIARNGIILEVNDVINVKKSRPPTFLNF